MVNKHDEWMASHNRAYINHAEKKKPFKIFQDNVKLIESFNTNENQTYSLKINEFADMTNEEFLASRNGFNFHSPNHLTASSEMASFRCHNVTEVPSSVDWRNEGAVTPVRDQGDCGCCWAISAVAATGLTKLKTGNLVSLSEQQLVDCETRSDGCSGGFMDYAYHFIISNDGLSTEEDYPYEAADGKCSWKNNAAKITGYEVVPENDEEALLKAVVHQPVSVAVDASGAAMQFYSSGVFTGECGSDLDHGVTAVGYGTSDDGSKFWLVKNLWGANWVEDGYMRIQRDVAVLGGLCGITKKASYPTID